MFFINCYCGVKSEHKCMKYSIFISNALTAQTFFKGQPQITPITFVFAGLEKYINLVVCDFQTSQNKIKSIINLKKKKQFYICIYHVYSPLHLCYVYCKLFMSILQFSRGLFTIVKLFRKSSLAYCLTYALNMCFEN